MFNGMYIFIHGGFSIVMLVFGGLTYTYQEVRRVLNRQPISPSFLRDSDRDLFIKFLGDSQTPNLHQKGGSGDYKHHNVK